MNKLKQARKNTKAGDDKRKLKKYIKRMVKQQFINP